MRILKKKITYKDKQYIVIVHKDIDYVYTHYAVYIRKPYCYIYQHEKFYSMFTELSLIEMIKDTFLEYITKQGEPQEELSEIDKIKEWDGVINEF